MEVRGATGDLQASRNGRLPTWLLAVMPLALIAVAIGAFALLGGPGLGERTGAPVEELAVEKTVLRPGVIELTVRNDGPDPVTHRPGADQRRLRARSPAPTSRCAGWRRRR